MIPIARPTIGVEDEEAVLRVLRSGRLAQGPEVEAFEGEFAPVAGARHAVACANGTAALQLALLAVGVGPGDEVIVPSLTFAASANAVLACGARPVFCDVSDEDYCIDVADAATRVTPATKVVMPVHLYGQPADMDAVRKLADERGLMVVEDAAQAVGATIGGRAAGSFGVAAFSLYATKNVMSGEGGMVTTNDTALDERLRLLRNHGMSERYVHTTFGLNLRLTDFAAALGRVQLARLGDGMARRRENAAFYRAQLEGIRGLILPREMPGRTHAWHHFTIRVPGRRDAVLKGMRERGVWADVYYPIPCHKQRSFGDASTLPVSERLTSEVLSIPVYPGLDDGERATVAKALTDTMMETA
jgi:perosamine synthetase